jgi:hypothetical protein
MVMIAKDRRQTIVYSVDKERGGTYRATVLLNATDKEDPSEYRHPLNVGQSMNVSCIGKSAFEAKENLLHGLRMWGFTGEFVRLYSKRYFKLLGSKSDYDKLKRPESLPKEQQSDRMLRRHYIIFNTRMDEDYLDLIKNIEGPDSRITRIIEEIEQEIVDYYADDPYNRLV